MQPPQEVKIESGQSHDRVVRVLLVRDHEVRGGIPYELEIVERGQDGLEVGWRSSEEGDVLDVRVVFWHVGNEMVYVVRRLPPPNAEAAAEVGNEGADEGVGDKVACDATVAGVMRCEHYLLLKGGVSFEVR